MNDLELDERDIARLLSVGRVAIGCLLVLAPRKAARAWTGEDDDSAVSALAVRGLGAREVGIGMGTLVALEEDRDIARWLQVGAVSDATDAFSVLSSFGRLPGLRRWALLATSATAAYLGWRAADTLE